MKNKDIIFDYEARNKLKNGIEKLNKAVKSTLGPAGQNVIVEDETGSPILTKDGVTVAKAIKLKDPVENLGVQLVKIAANKTAEEAGDGTTTSTILAYSIMNEALKLITTDTNSIEIKRGLDSAVKDVVKKLEEMSKDIKDTKEIEQIGIISSNNDKEIGKLLAEAMNKVGVDGVITIEESKTSETSLEMVEGMQFSKGYLSPYFINSKVNMQVEMEDAYILLYDKKLNNVNEKGFITLLEKVVGSAKPLLIIADDVSGPALATLIVNVSRGTMMVCAVKAPEFGERKKSILEDLAVLTNGTLISPDKGMTLDKVELDMLGKARKITINNKQTTIIDGAGEIEKISKRIDEIKVLIENADSNYEIERLQERLAKLTGGVAILNIGAGTEIETKEKKDRVEDALNATRAAVEEGIIPGGGIAFMNIFESFQYPEFENNEQKIGYEIVIKALKEPFNILVENSGYNGEAMWERIKNERSKIKYKDTKKNIGYDVRKKEIVDMYDSGIIDPLKVTRIALEKAVSIAGTLISSNCVISISPDENKESDSKMINMM